MHVQMGLNRYDNIVECLTGSGVGTIEDAIATLMVAGCWAWRTRHAFEYVIVYGWFSLRAFLLLLSHRPSIVLMRHQQLTISNGFGGIEFIALALRLLASSAVILASSILRISLFSFST